MSRTTVRTLLCALVDAGRAAAERHARRGPVANRSPAWRRVFGPAQWLKERHHRCRVEELHGERARLTLKASGLTPGKLYRLVGSSAPCGQPSTSSKRVFSKWFRVGSRGAAWLGTGTQTTAQITLTGSDWRDIRSTRLMEEGTFYFCRSTTNFVNTTFDDESASAAIAIVDAGNRHGIVIIDQLTDTTVRIRHDIQVGWDDAPRLIARSVGCAQPATTQSILTGMLLPVRGHGQTFGDHTESVSKDEAITIGGFRSVRVRDAGSPPWDCDAPSIIAILIGL